MAIIDVASRSITLKIVYYGCALGGKTTNLITLHQLTDPENTVGMVSIATKDDRTLFFDLLPMELGQVSGLNVKCKLYTVPGQVHYETTRRQVLGGADGVVLVADSSPEAKQPNTWAVQNLRFNLKANGLDPGTTPTVIQYNKRDLPTARPVEELRAELNPRRLPDQEAVAITGAGITETFASILKLSIEHCYRKIGRPVSPKKIGETVDQALKHARSCEPQLEEQPAAMFDHRFDMEAYRDQQAESGRDRRIVDEKSLLSEAVNANMKMAEQLGEYRSARDRGELRGRMMQALERLAPMLADPATAALSDGVMKLLLEGSGRRAGSILLFAQKSNVMHEREVVPAGRDPLNSVAEGSGSVAWRMSKGRKPIVVEDLQSEVFSQTAPPAGAEGLASALIAPLSCDGVAFGSLVVYSDVRAFGFDDAEREYLNIASTLIGLSFHWRALRRKLMAQKTAQADNSPRP